MLGGGMKYLNLAIIIAFSSIWISGCTEPNPFALQDGSINPQDIVSLDARKRGTEGGPCYPNKTCNAGLRCQNGICVKTTDGPLPDLPPKSDGDVPDAPANPCSPPGVKPMKVEGSSVGDWSVAIEDQATYTSLSISGASAKQAAAAFDYDVSGDQVASFVVSRAASSSSVVTEAQAVANDITKGVYGTYTVRQGGKASTSHDGYSRLGSAVLDLTRNSTTNVGWIRSLILASLFQTSTTKLIGLPVPWGSGATKFVIRFATVLRGDGRVLVIGAVTSRSRDDDLNRETSLIAGDVGSGSGLARTGKTTTDQCLGQTIAAPPKNFVDIIWVMDESGSMQSKRANIAANASNFFSEAQKRGLDFRMGVTNVVNPKGSWSSAVGKFCSVASGNAQHDGGPDHFLSSNDLSTFSACINNPPGYEGGSEYGLVNAREAVKRHLPRAANNKGKIRTGAQVVIIVVTDEVPQSFKDKNIIFSNEYKTCTLSPTTQAKVDAELKGYLDLFSGSTDPQAEVDHYHVIGGTCTSSGTNCNPDVAHGYRDLAAKLSGNLYDVCANNLGAAVTAIINGIVATGAPSLLIEVPISASVKISLDGATLKRSKVSGYYHPPLTKQIVFTGSSKPAAGSAVVLSYKKWK
jgi:hypothetical protein